MYQDQANFHNNFDDPPILLHRLEGLLSQVFGREYGHPRLGSIFHLADRMTPSPLRHRRVRSPNHMSDTHGGFSTGAGFPRCVVSGSACGGEGGAT